ncbi:MAG: peptide deformylase [Rhizobiaceae bacterium]
MAIKPILNIPDPILRQVSKPVERIDDALLRLLDDMLETMYEAPGIGLAGIQVGEPLRVVTIDVGEPEEEDAEVQADGEQDGEAVAADEKSVEGRKKRKRKPDPIFMINPRIVQLSDEPSLYEEGCLSIPEYYAEVERPASCTVSYLDRNGKEQLIEASGILSTCLQHEIDHLDGRLFIDHISKLKRDMVIRKFTKLARQKPASGRMVG